MIKLLIILLTISANISLIGQSLLPSEIVSRVINIKFGTSSGSGFLASYKNGNYLITAKHVLANANSGEEVVFEFYNEDVWKKTKGILLHHSNPQIDIAVIDLVDTTEMESHVNFSIDGIFYGSEGYFLGFPFGLKIENTKDFNSGFPLPLVKKALLSAVIRKNNINMIFLDGHNNPGFSGGPIVFKNPDNTSKIKWNIIGVISAYQNQKNEMETPFGVIDYYENSGIIIGYSIEHAIEIIENK